MLRFKHDLFATEDTVSRNVLISCRNSILGLLNISKDVYTSYDVKDVILKRKGLDGLVGYNTKMEEILLLDSTEENDSGLELLRNLNNPSGVPFYNDNETNTSINTVYSKTVHNIHTRYMNISKSKIFSLASKLKQLVTSDSFYTTIDLSYYYILPSQIVKFVLHINNLKNRRLTTKLKDYEYFSKYFDDRLDIMNSIDGDTFKEELSIREVQKGITSYIATNIVDIKPEFDETSGMWYLEFEFSHRYEKPISLVVNYEIVIFNYLIDKFYRLNTVKDRDNTPLKGRDYVYNSQDIKSYLTRIPSYDNENIKILSYYKPFLTALAILDEDKVSLININNLSKYISIEALNYIKKYFSSVSKDLKDIIRVSLQYNRIDREGLIIEQDGMIKSKEPLSYEYVYRVVISICVDVSVIDKKVINRFLDHFKDKYKDRHIVRDKVREVVIPDYKDHKNKTEDNFFEITYPVQTPHRNTNESSFESTTFRILHNSVV